MKQNSRSLSPETRSAISVKRQWVRVPIWVLAGFKSHLRCDWVWVSVWAYGFTRFLWPEQGRFCSRAHPHVPHPDALVSDYRKETLSSLLCRRSENLLWCVPNSAHLTGGTGRMWNHGTQTRAWTHDLLITITHLVWGLNKAQVLDVSSQK